MADTRPDTRLPLWPTLLAYGAPALPVYALLLVNGFFPFYYTETLGIGFGVAGTLVLVTRLWDMVTDPAIGILSDRTRRRPGRRKTWLLAGLPPVMAGTAGVFFAEPGMTPLVLGLLTMLLFLGWTMLALPLNAWSVELSGHYHERARISAVREGFALAGTVAALALLVQAAGQGPEAVGIAFERLGLGLLILFPLTVALAWRFVPDSPAPRRTGERHWRQDLSALARNAPLRRLSGAFVLNGIANGLPATLFLYYVPAVLDMEAQTGLFILLYFGMGILGVPVWIRVERRLGKHRTWMLAMSVAALAFLPAAFLGPGDEIIYGVVVTLTGLCLGADFFLPPAIAADVVDQDRLYTGADRAGLFFAMLSMLYKLSWAVAGAAGLYALGLADFSRAAGAGNPSGALVTLAALYALVPAVFKLSAVLVLRGFTLDEAAHRALRARLEAGAG